jgi:predicted DCC family thiol-disulfide oxidoreductase YuxK
MSRAVFEIAWQLGGIWSVIGLLSFLPNWAIWPFDAIYRLVARHRDRSCDLGLIRQNNQYLDRFLP